MDVILPIAMLNFYLLGIYVMLDYLKDGRKK